MKKIMYIIASILMLIFLFTSYNKIKNIYGDDDFSELTTTAYSKYGVINKYGKEIIAPVYDYVFDFYKGYATIMQKDKYGIADSTGTVIIPPKYDLIWRCNGNLIPVQNKNKWAFMDRKGNKITNFKYDDIKYIEEGFYRVQLNGKWGFFNAESHEITPIKYEINKGNNNNFNEGVLCVSLNGKMGFINSKGKEITPIKYDEAEQFENDRAKVSIDSKAGLIDENGKEIVPLIYDELIRISNSFSYAGIYMENGNDMDYAVINEKNGKVIIHLKYERYYDNLAPFFPFHARLAKIRLNEKIGAIDEKGKNIIPLIYDSIESLGKGYVVFKDAKYGYLDENFKIIVPVTNDYKQNEEFIYNICGMEAKESSLFLLCKNNKFGFANKKGKVLTPIKYDKIKYRYLGGAFVSIGEKSGYVNEKGKEIIPIKIAMPVSGLFYNFSEGILVYKENNKWGAIDSTGVKLVLPKYDSLEDFTWGFSIGKIANNWYLINKSGHSKTLKYDKVRKTEKEVAIVSKNEKIGMIDKDGNLITPIKYDGISSFNYNSAAVVKMNFNKYGFPVMYLGNFSFFEF